MYVDSISPRTCAACGNPLKKTQTQYCSVSCSWTGHWQKYRSDTDRIFWNRLTQVNTCRFWQGPKSKSGYGKISYDGKDWRTHRLAWFLTHGPIPPGMIVCHTCEDQYPPGDLTSRLCCNPDHLYLGTNKTNSADAIRTGRIAKGDRHSSVTHPESLKRGDENGSRSHPERLKRGDENGSRTHPERLARGNRNPLRMYPELVKHGEKNGAAKLTDDQVREMYARYHAGGISQQSLGDQYGVSQVMVGLIVNGKKWQTITLHVSK